MQLPQLSKVDIKPSKPFKVEKEKEAGITLKPPKGLFGPKTDMEKIRWSDLLDEDSDFGSGDEATDDTPAWDSGYEACTDGESENEISTEQPGSSNNTTKEQRTRASSTSKKLAWSAILPIVKEYLVSHDTGEAVRFVPCTASLFRSCSFCKVTSFDAGRFWS